MNARFRHRRTPRCAIFLLALLVACAFGAARCGRAVSESDEAENVPSAPVVLAVTASRVVVAPMRREIVLPGVTAALRTLTLRAPSSGRIVGLEITTGDSVRRGEIVGHIINREEDAAQAGLAAARKIDPAEAASLARSVSRYSNGSGIPIRVPRDGLVSQRLVSPDQIVNEFDPLVELVDPSSVYVDAQAPINRLGVLRAGMEATVVSALRPGITCPARVWSISPSFSAGGTAAPVWVQFTGADRIDEIGAAVDVHVTLESVSDAVVIPAAALFQDAARNTFYAFTIGSDGRAHRTSIAIGIRNSSAVQVTQGLAPGDMVITSGGYALSEGLRVRANVAPANDAHHNAKPPA